MGAAAVTCCNACPDRVDSSDLFVGYDVGACKEGPFAETSSLDVSAEELLEMIPTIHPYETGERTLCLEVTASRTAPQHTNTSKPEVPAVAPGATLNISERVVPVPSSCRVASVAGPILKLPAAHEAKPPTTPMAATTAPEGKPPVADAAAVGGTALQASCGPGPRIRAPQPAAGPSGLEAAPATRAGARTPAAATPTPEEKPPVADVAAVSTCQTRAGPGNVKAEVASGGASVAAEEPPGGPVESLARPSLRKPAQVRSIVAKLEAQRAAAEEEQANKAGPHLRKRAASTSGARSSAIVKQCGPGSPDVGLPDARRSHQRRRSKSLGHPREGLAAAHLQSPPSLGGITNLPEDTPVGFAQPLLQPAPFFASTLNLPPGSPLPAGGTAGTAAKAEAGATSSRHLLPTRAGCTKGTPEVVGSPEASTTGTLPASPFSQLTVSSFSEEFWSTHPVLAKVNGLDAESDEDVLPSMVPETWGEFLIRAAACLRESAIAKDAVTLFETFRTTDDLGVIFASFALLYTTLVRTAGEGEEVVQLPPWATKDEAPYRTWHYPYQLIQKHLGSNWKAKQLCTLLNEKVGQPQYVEAPCRTGRLKGRCCVVVGAGPCGLRAAIELRMLGAQVVVLEQRTQFTRINQLHIWSWCGEDLKCLGVKMIEPPPHDFSSNPDLLAIAINDLQKFLLKVALLFGVEVRMGVSYTGVDWHNGAWQTVLTIPTQTSSEGRSGPETNTNSFGWSAMLPPSQFSPGMLRDIAVVIGCGGFASTVGDKVGMRMIETDSLRKETAIGLICNIRRTFGKAEAALRSYSLARQFYTALFAHAAQETGVDLENIVYVKAVHSHYFVMTPTPRSLIKSGVVIDESHKPMLDRANIDQGKLDELVRRLLSYRFKQDEPTVMEAVSTDLGGTGLFPGYADSGPRLFDFSRMRRSSEGLLFLPPAGGGSEDGQLLVALGGDALIEPFWPEGLGIVRGFLSVLDACHAVQMWSGGASSAATQEGYTAAFQKLKTLSAQTRERVLHKDEQKFMLAPFTRYRR